MWDYFSQLRIIGSANRFAFPVIQTFKKQSSPIFRLGSFEILPLFHHVLRYLKKLYIVWSFVRRRATRHLTRLQTMCNVLRYCNTVKTIRCGYSSVHVIFSINLNSVLYVSRKPLKCILIQTYAIIWVVWFWVFEIWQNKYLCLTFRRKWYPNIKEFLLKIMPQFDRY